MWKPTSLENTEKWKWLLLKHLAWKSRARPPKHDWRARETESSVKRKRNRRNMTRRKKDPSGVGRGWCTGDLKRRRISSWNSNPMSKSSRWTRSEEDPMAGSALQRRITGGRHHGARRSGGGRGSRRGGEASCWGGRSRDLNIISLLAPTIFFPQAQVAARVSSLFFSVSDGVVCFFF